MSQSGPKQDSKAASLLDALFEEAQASPATEIRENLRAAGRDPEQVVAEMRAMATELVMRSRMARLTHGDCQLRLPASNRHRHLATSAKPMDVEMHDDAPNHVRRVSEEAAHWWVLSTDDKMSSCDRRTFLAWLRQAPENVAELLKMVHLNHYLRRNILSSRDQRRTQKKMAESSNSGNPYALHRECNELAENARRRSTQRGRRLRLTSGAIAALLVVGVFMGHEYIGPEQVVTTGASEWHTMTLPDGTAVHLDARSSIKVEYIDEARIVHVNEGGAVFEVKKDPKRPFVARTYLVDVTAVGTRFGVSIGEGVVTTVSEGSVRVTGRRRPDGKSVTLKAGEELRVTGSGLTSPHLARVDAERKLQWARDGRLNLGGMTVAQGVEELNRRNRVQIVIESPALAARVVEATIVRANAPEKYARAVAAEPGVKMAVDEKNGIIRLSD